MRHVAFVLWMIGWPLVSAMSNAIYHVWVRPHYVGAGPFTVEMAGFCALVDLVVWGVVGLALWRVA